MFPIIRWVQNCHRTITRELKSLGFVIWCGTVVPFGPLAMHQLIVGNNPKDAFDIALIAGFITLPDYLDRLSYSGERNIKEEAKKSNYRVFRRLRNKHAVLLLLVFFIENLGFATIGILTPYVAEYIVLRPERTAIYILTYLIPCILSVPLDSLVQAYRKEKDLVDIDVLSGLDLVGCFSLRGSDTLILILAFVCGFGAGSGAAMAHRSI